MRLKKSFKLHGSEGWGGMGVGVRDHRTMNDRQKIITQTGGES